MAEAAEWRVRRDRPKFLVHREFNEDYQEYLVDITRVTELQKAWIVEALQDKLKSLCNDLSEVGSRPHPTITDIEECAFMGHAIGDVANMIFALRDL